MLQCPRRTFVVMTLILASYFPGGAPLSKAVSSQVSFENLPTITIDNADQIDELDSCDLQNLTGQLAWSPDGKYLAIASASGAQLLELVSFCESEPDILKTDAGLSSVFFSTDGKLLVGGDSEGNAYVWETDSHKEALKLHAQDGAVRNISVDPVLDLLLTHDTKSLRFWIMSKAKIALSIPIPRGDLTSVTVNAHKGQIILGDLGGGIQVADIVKSEIIATRGLDTGVSDLAVNRDGTVLAVAGIGRIYLLSMPMLDQLAELKNDFEPSILAFSSEADLLASATPSGTIHLWDTVASDELMTITRSKEIIDLAFSPTGDLLAMVDVDNSVHLYGISSDN